MLKPDSLRNALYDAVPVLRTNPDMLRLFVDNGKIAATLAASLSFEKQYTLNVVVTDFTGILICCLSRSWHGCGSNSPTS
jgi:hypothetical protein